MIEINGSKYSRKRFDDYSHRVIVILEKNNKEYRLEIYTTNVSRDSLLNTLLSRMKEGVSFVRLDHWCTRSQDDATNKMLEDLILRDNL